MKNTYLHLLVQHNHLPKDAIFTLTEAKKYNIPTKLCSIIAVELSQIYTDNNFRFYHKSINKENENE